MSETVTEYVLAKKDDLVSMADAIRSKTGSTENIALNAFASLVSAIETSGGADEILSLFGGSKYKIGSVTAYNDTWLNFPAIENLTSVDDVKLVVAIHSNYVEGISLAIPESIDSYTLLYVGISVNGLSGEFYITDSDIKASAYNTNNIFSTNYTANVMRLNTPQPVVFKDGTFYYLIIYNETQE